MTRKSEVSVATPRQKTAGLMREPLGGNHVATGGNQRELARARAKAKTEAQQGSKRKDGLPPNKRQEHDAEIMRKKQMKKDAMAAAPALSMTPH